MTHHNATNEPLLGRRIAKYTVWPRQLELFRPRASLVPKRDISQVNPRSLRPHHSPKLGREVACESLTEANFYQALDGAWNVADYCEQPLWIPYRHRGRYTYHPDAHISLMDGRRMLVEIKCESDLGDFRNFRKWTSLFHFAHPIGYGVFIGDTEGSFPEAMRRQLDPDLLLALSLFARSESGAAEEHMKILRKRFTFSDSDLAAAVLQCGLFMTRKPFVLRSPRPQEETLIKELRAAFAGFGRDTGVPQPLDSTVPGISAAALGIAARGNAPWFMQTGWSYGSLTKAYCPRCADGLHVLRKPWTAPSKKVVRARAVVCGTCATARTMNAYPDDVQRLIRAA